MRRMKMAKLTEADIEAIKALEKKLGNTCLVAVEKSDAMYALEAKTAPNVWEPVHTVYPEIEDLKSYYPDQETAKLAKGGLKGLLNSTSYKKRKKPIRIRKIS